MDDGYHKVTQLDRDIEERKRRSRFFWREVVPAVLLAAAMGAALVWFLWYVASHSEPVPWWYPRAH